MNTGAVSGPTAGLEGRGRQAMAFMTMSSLAFIFTKDKNIGV